MFILISITLGKLINNEYIENIIIIKCINYYYQTGMKLVD